MGKSHRKRRKELDWIELWTGVVISFYLLFMGVHGYVKFATVKTITFYVLTGLLLLLGAALLLRDLEKKRKLTPSPAQIAALAYLGFTVLSALCSEMGEKAWYNGDSHEAALTVICYALVFLIVSRWGRPTERLFRVFFWSVAAFCLICILQILGANPLKLYPEGYSFYEGFSSKEKGLAGTVGNFDVVSAYLALAVPLLLLHTRGQKAKQAWPCWVLAACCLAIMFVVKVLGGLVGLVLGGVVCLAVLCPDGKRKWVLIALGGLALTGLVVLWLFDLPGFFHELHELLHGRIDDKFGSGRIYIWRQIFERLPKRLWTGVGPDMTRFSGLEPFVRRDELGNLVLGSDGRPITARITDAHCHPLQILYCQGLPAFLSWLGMVGISLYHWVKLRKDRAAAILGGGLICFLCAMLFCISSVIIMPFFWVTMGLIEAQYQKSKQSG